MLVIGRLAIFCYVIRMIIIVTKAHLAFVMTWHLIISITEKADRSTW